MMRAFTDLELTRMVGIPDAAQRARLTWFSIQRQPVSVVMTRPGTISKTSTAPAVPMVLPAQVIRIDGDSRANLVQVVAGQAPVWQAEITGVKDHPTVPETDIDEGYTFTYEGNHYRVTEVWREPGKIRAIAMVNG